SAADNPALLGELSRPTRVIRFPWIPLLSDHPALAHAAEASGLVAAAAPALSVAGYPDAIRGHSA
ncbi:MAG: hypothetical protein ACRENC_18260, partial [Gemmatimonadaceae bacterium]